MARLTAEEKKKKKEQFLEAYEKSHGLEYLSADEVGIPRRTLTRWKDKDKEFAAKMKEIDDKVGNLVVGKLMEKILEGDRASIFFYLKCKQHWHESQKIVVENVNDVDITEAIKELRRDLKNEK